MLTAVRWRKRWTLRIKARSLMERVSDAMINLALRIDSTMLDPRLPVVVSPAASRVIVPAAIDNATSEATSDLILMQLETIHVSGIPGTAASMAIGYADAYARFALRHPDAFD